MFLLDITIYGQHVEFHAVPLLWRLHRMHHADLEFDVTTGLRFHPGELLLSMVIKLAAVTVLGAPPVAVLLLEILLNATSLFNHRNVRLPLKLDRILRLIVVTPDMHRVHHSIDRRETHSNLGFNVPWRDRLFGTYRAQPALGHERMTIGKVGAVNVEFRLGELEHLPIADDTADVIISNCVINLVPDKAQVLRNSFRVLRPGGRMSVSDVLNVAPLPEDLRADPALLCGCVAGAISAERTETLLREAGFVDISIAVNPKSRDTIASWAPGRGIENCVASATVEARKPPRL